MRKLHCSALAALAMASSVAFFVSLNSPAAQAQSTGMVPGPGAPAPAGTWNAVGLQDDEVVKAAKFALQEQNRQTQAGLKLLSIKHARLQVLEGMHYSMNLMVLSEGKKRLIIAVVWAKPDGRMELTRWHWV